MTTPFDFLRSRTIWYFALILAINLFSGCNYFLTPCSEEVVCTTLADGGGTEDGGIIGPTRKFESRAKVSLDAAKLKYVGMKGTTPVFLWNEMNNRSSWVAYQLELLTEKDEERRALDMNRIGFPAAPDHDFLNTPILVSGGFFYGLFPKERQISFVEPRSELHPLAKLPDSPPYVYFRHPQIAGFAVSAKPTLMNARSTTLIHWAGPRYSLIQYNDEPVTQLVMGDLDSIDPAPNGRELILLEGTKVQNIFHEGVGSGAPSDDTYLSFGLQQALDRNEIVSPILAGFVSSLNADKCADFVYARGPNLYVTSYVGRSAAGIGLFVDWPKDSFPPLIGETVRSIQAIDLTQDGYPELVVETDRYVHFYLNNPIP